MIKVHIYIHTWGLNFILWHSTSFRRLHINLIYSKRVTINYLELFWTSRRTGPRSKIGLYLTIVINKPKLEGAVFKTHAKHNRKILWLTRIVLYFTSSWYGLSWSPKVGGWNTKMKFQVNLREPLCKHLKKKWNDIHSFYFIHRKYAN